MNKIGLLLGTVAYGAIASIAFAGVTGNNIVTPQIPQRFQAQITNATGTNPVTLWQPSTSFASTTASVTAATLAFTVASTAGIAVGQTIFGNGMPTGNIVMGVASTSVTGSFLTTAGGTGVAVSFYNVSGPNGIKISAFACTNTDASNNYNLTVQVIRNSQTMIKEVVQIPAGAGTVSGIPSVDMFNPNGIPNAMAAAGDNVSNRYLTLNVTDLLQISAGTAVNSGKVITCDTTQADF